METLRMIRWGMMAGFTFLAALAVLEWLASPPGAVRNAPGGGSQADVSNQVWQVLAEARRITEEAS